MDEDELLLIEEPLFCCLLPLALRLSGPGCDKPACGDLKNARVHCRVLRRERLKLGLFAVTLTVHVSGTFRGRRVRGVRGVTLKLPHADKETRVECRIVAGSTATACICQQDGTDCEACLTVLVCVLSPCPDELTACHRKRCKVRRIVRTPSRSFDCPACAELKHACPPFLPKPCT